MPLPKNIFAFTAPGAEYPEYLSINDVDGKVEITVRGPRKPPTEDRPYVQCGDCGCMTIPRSELIALATALLKEITNEKT